MREPVDEEHDVPRLLLDDVLEDVEQGGGKQRVLAGELEETEGAEGIEALLEARNR